MRGRAAELGLSLASLAVVLLALELGLRGFTRLPPDDAATRRPDPVLRWRMNPEWLPEIDARGFRNPAALAAAEIAVIGDSHTYGFNAPPEAAWPAQLGRLTGRSVYSLGVGGYGLLEYWHLLEEALSLGPRHVVVGVYVVNDLADVCGRVRDVPHWRPWLGAHGIDTRRCEAPQTSSSRGRGHERDFWEWLGDATAVGALWDVSTIEQRVRLDIWRGAVEKAFVVDAPRTRTVMHNRWLRGIRENTDPERPAIAVALEVARRFFADARERSAAQGCRLGVLVIPSKAAVYARYLVEGGIERPEVYTAAVAGEALGTASLERILDEVGVPWLDARPRLERALVEEGGLYPLRRDDHPFAAGYRAYAETARELVARLDGDAGR